MGPETGSLPVARGHYRMARGGSWYAPSHLARVAHRYGDEPSWRYGFQGFRVARSYP